MPDNLWDLDPKMHGCTMPGCTYADSDVCYDDEPYCFDHSPDEGSAVSGYSYRAEQK